MRFVRGMTPWNKGLRGIHLSPGSEYRKGRRSEKWLPVGTVTMRRHKYDKPRMWLKVAEPNVWKLRAVVVWERKHGRLPRGHIVHHKDHDTLNDSPRNLEALTRAEHVREHKPRLHR
jgi:HNH endonuclease